MPFRVGDEVEWTSQAGGYRKTKRGVVMAVVPPGGLPRLQDFRAETYIGRGHESYIVHVKGIGRYWPRVKQLRLVP